MAPGAAARYVELLLEKESTRAALLDDPDSVNALFDALRDAVQAALQSETLVLASPKRGSFRVFESGSRQPVYELSA